KPKPFANLKQFRAQRKIEAKFELDFKKGVTVPGRMIVFIRGRGPIERPTARTTNCFGRIPSVERE
ncbi:Unknown protein, partial [Striga hermonthica]